MSRQNSTHIEQTMTLNTVRNQLDNRIRQLEEKLALEEMDHKAEIDLLIKLNKIDMESVLLSVESKINPYRKKFSELTTFIHKY